MARVRRTRRITVLFGSNYKILFLLNCTIEQTKLRLLLQTIIEQLFGSLFAIVVHFHFEVLIAV